MTTSLFPWSCLEEAFPFLFAWDADSQLKQVGPSLSCVGNVEIAGRRLDEVFVLEHSSEKISAVWLGNNTGRLILVRHLETGMLMRGQVLVQEDWLGVFLGAPWLTSPDELDRLGLSLTHFAPHDAALDVLYVLQAHQTANRELFEINQKLRAKGRLLIEKEAEARKLALVAERTDNAVILADREGKIEWVNKAFERLTGWRMEDVLGQKPGSFLQGSRTDPAVAADMGMKLKRGDAFRTEILNYRKDGSPYWVDIEVQPIFSDDGTLTHFMALESDISDQKRNEMCRKLEMAVSRVITETQNLNEAIQSLLHLMAVDLEWSQAGWWCLDSVSEQLKLQQSWHAELPKNSEFVERGKMINLARGDDLPGQVWAKGKSVWLTNLQQEENFPRKACALSCGLIAGLAFPVSVRGQFRGVLEFFSQHLDLPDENLLETLNRIGGQVGMLIERLEAEDALRRSERLMNKGHRIAGLGNWTLEPSSGKIEWSDQTYIIFGYEPRSVEVDLDFCWRAIHPDDLEGVQAAVKNTTATGEVMNLTFRLLRPDGEMRCVRCTSELELTHEKVATALIGTLLDITELVSAQDTLRETEERWQFALQNNGLGVWDWNVQNGFVLYTDPLQEMLGYAAGEWPQHVDSWASRVHPDDIAMVMGEMSKYLAGESASYICEHRLRCKDGSWKWVQDVGRIVSRTKDGQPLRMIGTQMDIHIRKQAEMAASSRESLLKKIQGAQERFIATPDPTPVFSDMLDVIVGHTESSFGFIGEVLHDENGSPYLSCYAVSDISWNDETGALFEAMSPRGLEFRNLKTLFGVAMVTREVVMTNDAANDPRRGGLPPGTPPIDSFLGLPVHNGLEMVGLIGLANRRGGFDQDILRSLDPFLAAFSSMIVSRRETRRLEKDQANLREARDRAETANRAKSDFLTMISHEIRTPMNGVIGMARLLCTSNLDEHQMEMAEAVVQSGTALVSIMDDILDFAKIEAGKLELREQPLSVDEVLEGVADLLAHEAAAKGISICTVLSPGLPAKVLGDAGRLRQVLLNLAGNAVKFTDHGSVTLRASYSDQELQFKIEDTGIGMAQNDLERLFTPFTQLDSSATRRFGGAGMGLAICKKLIERMNGSIRVESRPGEGSCFTVRVPAQELEPSSPTDTRRFIIWIADEEANIREGLCAALQESHDLRQMENASQLLSTLHAADANVLVIKASWLDSEMRESVGHWLSQATEPARRLIVTTTLHEDLRLPQEWNVRVVHRPVRRQQLRDALLSSQSGDPLRENSQASVFKPERPLGLRVLMAEDNRVNARLVGLILEKLGCECDIMPNGLEAVGAFQRCSYDVVLMDCQMPVMDGYEAVRRIREIESQDGDRHHRCHIIAMTANAAPEERQRCLATGMDAYLAKPFDADVLSKMLAGLTPHHQMAELEQHFQAAWAALSLQVGQAESIQLASLWLEEASTRSERLQQAFSSGRCDEVKKEAHAVRGSCYIFGMSSVEDACQTLEETIAAQMPPSPLQVAAVAREIERGSTWLRRAMKG